MKKEFKYVIIPAVCVLASLLLVTNSNAQSMEGDRSAEEIISGLDDEQPELFDRTEDREQQVLPEEGTADDELSVLPEESEEEEQNSFLSTAEDEVSGINDEEEIPEEISDGDEELYTVELPSNPISYTIGNTVSVALTEDEYNGWYRFTLDKTCVGRIRNTATKDQNVLPSADLYIYDASGNFLLAKYNSGTMFFSLLKGTYYIRYQSYSHAGTVSFQITTYDENNHYQSFEEDSQNSAIRNNSESSASVLTPGNVYHGLVGRNNAVDWYTFTLTENTYVQISQVDFYEYYGTVKIMDSNKNDVLKQDENNAKDAMSSTILKPGTYYAYAERFNYNNNTNGVTSYRIVLGEDASEEYKLFQPVLYPAYTLGETKTLDLSASHTKWYQLNLDKSSIIKARMSHSLSDYVPALRIYDLTFHRYLDTNGAHTKYIGLLKGIYFIEIYEGDLTSGSVSFCLSAVDGDQYFQTYEEAYHNRSVRNDTKLDANVIDSVEPYTGHEDLDGILDDPFCSSGKTICGIIGNNNNLDWYKVTATGKLIIDIKEEYYANYSSALIVYDENKTPVSTTTISSEGSEGGRQTVVRQCLVNPGTYYIRAQRFNYNNNRSEAAMAYKIGLTEIKTVPIELDTYYDGDPVALGDGLFYYHFSVENDDSVMDISVDFASAPTEPDNVVCLYDSKLEQLTVRNEEYSLVTNPQILTFHEGHKIVFRRIKLAKGDYYFTIRQTKSTSSPAVYGFSDIYGIYITTYRSGFDLTRDAMPVRNTQNAYDVLLGSNGTVSKGNAEALPDDALIDVFGNYNFRKYGMKGTKDPYYCFGFSTVALKEYENGSSCFLPYRYNNSLNTNGKDGYHPVSTQEPIIYTSSELQKYLSRYVAWANCSLEGKTARKKNCLTSGFSSLLKNTEEWKNTIKDDSSFVLCVLWSGKGHALVVDKCRNILNNPEGKGTDWHRVYLYDCNAPYEHDITLDDAKWYGNAVFGPTYGRALRCYMDFNDEGSWVIPELGVDSSLNPVDVGSKPIQGDKGELYLVDVDDIPDSFSSNCSVAPKFGNILAKLWWDSTLGDYRYYFSVIKDELELLRFQDGKVISISDELVEYPPIGNSGAMGTDQFLLPEGEYSMELSGCELELIQGNGYVKIATEDSVTVDMVSESELVLSSPDVATVNVTVTEANEEDDEYKKVRSEIEVNAGPTVVKIQNGKATIDASVDQIINLELETESGEEVIENLSTDDIDGLEIEKYISGLKITFDEQGGSDVKNMSGITANTCVQMPASKKEGFNFGGWFTEKDGKGTQYTSTTPIDQNLTLYAYWTEKSSTDPGDDDIPEDAPDGIWIRGFEKEYTYTGSPIKPSFKVYRGKTRLYEKTDYTLKFANNTKPGTANVTVTMKGNHSGSKDLHFQIVPADLSKDITADKIYLAYKKNKAQKPKPVLYIDGTKLKFGANDLMFTYPSEDKDGKRAYVDEGTYRIHIEPKNNKLFTGNTDVDLVIVQKTLMNAVSVRADKNSLVYDDGKEISPVFTLTYKNQPLTKDQDYTVSYADDPNTVGKHTVIFTGNNTDYFGSKVYTFTVTGKYDLASARAEVSLDPEDLDEDGKALFTYGGAMPGAIVKYNGVKLTAGKDYTVSYKNHKALGTATATVKGKGSYKGSVPIDFTVKQRDINTLSLNLGDVLYTVKKDGYKKVPVSFVDQNYKDQKLKANTDYSLTFIGTYGDAPAAGTEIRVRIKGKGNYTGTIEASYRIKDKALDFSKAKVSVNGGKAYDYTGSRIEPAKTDLVVTLANKPLGNDDYEILGCYNNIKKGNSAYIRLRGKGSYAGDKVVKFKIGAAPLEWIWSDVIIRLKGIFNP